MNINYFYFTNQMTASLSLNSFVTEDNKVLHNTVASFEHAMLRKTLTTVGEGGLDTIRLDSPSLKNALYHVYLKFACRRKFHQYIFAISLLSPLEKGRGPSFEET